MLVVTGTGRSGTSALAGYLFRMDLPVGGKYNEKILGGYEHREVVTLNNKILNNEPFSQDEIKAVDLEVVKDPRFFFPKVLREWLSVRDDLKFLLCFRAIDQTLQGAKRHPDHFFTNSASASDEELKQRMRSKLANFMEKVLEKDIPYASLTFPNFLEQHDKVYEVVCRLLGKDLDVEKSRQVWSDWMDPDKVHYRSTC